MPKQEGPSSEETERRPGLGRVSKREIKEEGVSEIKLSKKRQRRMKVGRWKYGRHRWTRGADVADASTTETLSCTIHR